MHLNAGQLPMQSSLNFAFLPVCQIVSTWSCLLERSCLHHPARGPRFSVDIISHVSLILVDNLVLLVYLPDPLLFLLFCPILLFYLILLLYLIMLFSLILPSFDTAFYLILPLYLILPVYVLDPAFLPDPDFPPDPASLLHLTFLPASAFYLILLFCQILLFYLVLLF
jgi:hypothetical protein